MEKEDAENELPLAIIACSPDLNTDHKFKREDRLRVLVCVFVLATPIRFCCRLYSESVCARAYPFFVCFVLHTNSGLCSPTKFPVLSVRPLSPTVLVPYHLILVSLSVSGVAPLP